MMEHWLAINDDLMINLDQVTMVHPEAERAAAQRMGAKLTEIAGGSRAIALSHPEEVTNVMLDAVASINRGG